MSSASHNKEILSGCQLINLLLGADAPTVTKLMF